MIEALMGFLIAVIACYTAIMIIATVLLSILLVVGLPFAILFGIGALIAKLIKSLRTSKTST